MNISVQNVSDSGSPPGCSANFDLSSNSWTVTLNHMMNTTSACSSSSGSLRAVGEATSLLQISLDLNAASQKATITLKGPANVWFGVGFNATTMAELPYAIIVDGTGSVSERRLGSHAAGTVLKNSIVVSSNTVSGEQRTVVLQRRVL